MSAEDGSTTTELPRIGRQETSDSHRNSPWSKKIVLTFDGGGVKGYTSLLIIKRLLYLIEKIERGIIPALEDGDSRIEKNKYLLTRRGSHFYYRKNESSEEYPWGMTAEHALPEVSGDRLQHTGQEEIELSVKDTFEGANYANNFKLHHYFDYMVGTSTGGLSALMLGRMEMDIESVLSTYDDVGEQVFRHPRPLQSRFEGARFFQSKYAATRIEEALKTVIETALAPELKQWNRRADEAPLQHDEMRCRVIVVSTAAASHQLELFRSYDHLHPSPFSTLEVRKGHLNPGHANQDAVWRVGRATSAAPTYFKEAVITERGYIDGGLGANNPSRLAWTEVAQIQEFLPHLLFSVGTGITQEDIDTPPKRRHVSFVCKYYAKGKDFSRWLQSVATDTENSHCSMQEIAHGRESEYYRVNVEYGQVRVQLDEWAVDEPSSSTNLKRRLLAHASKLLPTIRKATTTTTTTTKKPPPDSDTTPTTEENPSSPSPSPILLTKVKMLTTTAAHLSNPPIHAALLAAARTLALRRRVRAHTERWEAFATDAVYYCPERACATGNDPPSDSGGGGARGGRTFATRDALRRHALEAHDFVQHVRARIDGEEGEEEGEREFERACWVNGCREDVTVCRSVGDWVRHVRERHGVSRGPRFRDRREFEGWLDLGRRGRRAEWEAWDEEVSRTEKGGGAKKKGRVTAKVAEKAKGRVAKVVEKGKEAERLVVPVVSSLRKGLRWVGGGHAEVEVDAGGVDAEAEAKGEGAERGERGVHVREEVGSGDQASTGTESVVKAGDDDEQHRGGCVLA